MGESAFYVVYLRGTPLYRVLFYAPKIEFWAEPENQTRLEQNFRKISHWANYEIISIEPTELPYNDVVTT